jgi:starvation-inducible DNA-binding protein
MNIPALELRQNVVETVPYLLSVVFAESYILLTKLQSSHWNYTGPDFYSKHILFERLYGETYTTLDRIAESIRGMDSITPVSLYSLLTLSKIQTVQDDDPAFISDRLYLLIEDIATIRGSIATLALQASQQNKQFILNLCGDLDEMYGSFYYLISSHLK